MADKISMGIGNLMDPNVVYKRKFRWTFTLTPKCPGLAKVPPSFVKLASRPNISFDETELNFLNAKAWIPGKASVETMTVTYLDVSAKRPEAQALYAYLGSVYSFQADGTKGFDRKMGSSVGDYTTAGDLVMYDGCGTPIETWHFEDLWPQVINFGDVDYTSSDTCDIELTFRYSQFTYTSHCGDVPFVQCCTGC